MRNYLQSSGSRGAQDVDETKQKLASEKQEIEKVRSERREIVEKLIEQSALAQGEKDRIAAELQKKEEELLHSQAQLVKLNRHLTIERVSRHKKRTSEPDPGMEQYTRDRVIEKIGVDRVRKMASASLKSEFSEIITTLARGYIEDLDSHGYFENGLTNEGVKFLRRLAVPG